MNTTHSPSQMNAAFFQGIMVSASFQNILYDSTMEARTEMIEGFLPFHNELGVGEDFLRQLLEDLANGEVGAIRNFAGHLIMSSNAFSTLWRAIYG